MLPILAAAAFTMAGPVTASASAVETIEAMDFNSDDGQLIGYRLTPGGPPTIGYFTHAGMTAHLAGTPNHPPAPITPASRACSGLANAWDASVLRGEPAAPNRLRILSRLAQHSCYLDITIDSTTSPPTLVTIQPLE
jgi:hypothetical protein